MPRVAIIAGETSGDMLGAGLINALRARRPDLDFVGIGGPRMQAAGCECWFDASELAVMGLAEVLRHLPRLRQIIRTTRQRVIDSAPDVLVGIDAPDFNFRVEPYARRSGITTIHYVSPQVWAWRQRRVGKLHQLCDHVLCLLPFEAEFLREHGMPATFVGHPLADEIPAGLDAEPARTELGLGSGPVLALLPGSRRSEVSRLGPVFADAAHWLAPRVTNLQCIAAMASPEMHELFNKTRGSQPTALPIRAVVGQTRTVLQAADVVLVASGTATLETMLVNRPMVVAYRLALVSYLLARLLRLVKLEHFSLPNVLAGHGVVPEFLQGAASGEVLGAELLRYLESPEPGRMQVSEFARLRGQLERSASVRAADVVLQQAGLG